MSFKRGGPCAAASHQDKPVGGADVPSRRYSYFFSSSPWKVSHWGVLYWGRGRGLVPSFFSRRLNFVFCHFAFFSRLNCRRPTYRPWTLFFAFAHFRHLWERHRRPWPRSALASHFVDSLPRSESDILGEITRCTSMHARSCHDEGKV